jgi:hypothetical protein
VVLSLALALQAHDVAHAASFAFDAAFAEAEAEKAGAQRAGRWVSALRRLGSRSSRADN